MSVKIRRPSLSPDEDLIVQLAEQSGSFGYPVVAAPAGGQHHRHHKVGGVTWRAGGGGGGGRGGGGHRQEGGGSRCYTKYQSAEKTTIKGPAGENPGAFTGIVLISGIKVQTVLDYTHTFSVLHTC